ncbi:MAG: flavin reductase family protein [Lachnospiraceae bacterium]|nr:flavin reductase family protein [Lachnospiraceae bacterium]
MEKQIWKPGNMLYPLPAVLVSLVDRDGKPNILTVAWTATVCTNPPMLSISVRPERYSYQGLVDTGEFTVNLTTEELVFATDFCGVRSGRDVDKFQHLKLSHQKGEKTRAPLIGESPVNIECRVQKIEKLGSHHMFLASVEAVHAQSAYMDEKGRFDLSRAKPIVYSHGEYYSLGKKLGKFGYSIQKKKDREFRR